MYKQDDVVTYLNGDGEAIVECEEEGTVVLRAWRGLSNPNRWFVDGMGRLPLSGIARHHHPDRVLADFTAAILLGKVNL